MTEKIFTPDERKAYEEQAHKRGFKTLRDYIRSLVELDAKQGEAVDLEDEDDELDDPSENFRRAWGEAMRGELLTEEEFWDAIADDE